MSNSFAVGPNLDQKRLQRLSADDSRVMFQLCFKSLNRKRTGRICTIFFFFFFFGGGGAGNVTITDHPIRPKD